MGVSMIDLQRDAVLAALRDAGQGQWKVLIVDESSWKLMENILKEDEILNQHITNIEHIERRRQTLGDIDAIYILTPEPHIVDCLMADLERRRYRQMTLLWTGLLHASLRERIDRSLLAREQITSLQVIDVGFHPRESNLVTFKDPYSFPILYHPSCSNLVRQHIEGLAQKVVSVCVSLGEYPNIRYYKPRAASHEASVLCSHLSRFIQDEMDMYATYHKNFPPPSTRPRGTLYILDRSWDLQAPLLHEFSYQSMVHDLLPIKEGDKVTYKMTVNQGQPDQQDKDVEISERDKIWVANRHLHMKDTIEKLMGEFQKFIDENPHFTKADDNANSLNAIKDMMAGLPQFQEMKEAYSLHLTMAQECMNAFQQRKLADLAAVEQTLATGLDEDHRKPKAMTDQVVRSLDNENVSAPDRLRLILLYLIYRDGIPAADTSKLLAHAGLAAQDTAVAHNLSLLGARITRHLKEKRDAPEPLFPRKPPQLSPQQEYSLSRFEPALKRLLEDHARGQLSQDFFPYTKPQLDAADPVAAAVPSSLRSAKPTWAKTRTATTESKQRVIVFIAGGATYSESRAAYEATATTNKDVYLLTSHMLTPSLFLRQLGDLSVDRRMLNIPAEQPPKKAPAYLFEPDPPAPLPIPTSQPHPSQPPTQQMGGLALNNGSRMPQSVPSRNGHANIAAQTAFAGGQAKPPQETKDDKKKRGLFGRKK